MKPKPHIQPFERWHYQAMREISPPNGAVADIAITYDMLLGLEKQHSYTVLVDKVPIAAGGLIRLWETHYQAWTYMTHLAAPHILAITRAAKVGMQHVKGRITMTTPTFYKDGIRWAQILGFEIETPVLRKWGPFGEDHVGFVKIQD